MGGKSTIGRGRNAKREYREVSQRAYSSTAEGASAQDSSLFNVPIGNVKFSGDDPNIPSRPSSPALRGRLHPGLVASSSSRPSTPNPFGTGSSHTNNRAPTAHALHPKHPIQTPQQFYDWFALIDRSVAHSQEAHFRAHLASVAEHLETCETLLKRIDEVDSEVNGMLQGWRSVEDGGKSLKGACEQLLEERVRVSYRSVVACDAQAPCMTGSSP